MESQEKTFIQTFFLQGDFQEDQEDTTFIFLDRRLNAVPSPVYYERLVRGGRVKEIPFTKNTTSSEIVDKLLSFFFGAWLVFELHSLLVTKKCIGIEKVTFDGIKTMTSTTPITLFTLKCEPGSGCKKILKIKGTRNYYFKTIGYCSRTKVKSSLILRRFYATWPDHLLTCQSEQAPIEGEQMIFSLLSQTGNLFTRGSTRLNELVTKMCTTILQAKGLRAYKNLHSLLSGSVAQIKT